MQRKQSTRHLSLGHNWDIGTRLGHYVGICWGISGYIKKSKKIAQTLANTGFKPLMRDERAGIRTPDNLIKSQGVESPLARYLQDIPGCVWDTFETL